MGARPRKAVSRNSTSSTNPAPLPPYSSGSDRASQPSSPISRRSLTLLPSVPPSVSASRWATVAQRRSQNARTAAANCSCSAVKRTSGTPVLAELGLALLVEGGDALLGLLGLAEELQRGVGHVADADHVLGVGVERLLEHLERRGGVGVHRGRPLPDLVLELRRGDDLVHQSPVQCLLGGQPAQHEPDLAGPLLADHAGEVPRAEAGVEG